MARLQECSCGSGEYPEAQTDADGIFLCYTCSKCEEEKLAKYRPDIFTRSSAEYGENIEDD